jgi:hypothetical protein
LSCPRVPLTSFVMSIASVESEIKGKSVGFTWVVLGLGLGGVGALPPRERAAGACQDLDRPETAASTTGGWEK